MQKILIVEDDEGISRMLEATLQMAKYQCGICRDGSFAPEEIREGRYDLVLLDVMLPGLDGFQIMEQVQELDTPVIFLTAKENGMDKVKGLRMGAEDYITKPFEPMELLARIEVVLRRRNKGRTKFVYEDIQVDLERHQVRKGDQEVALTPKEFDVLVFFLQHQDIAVTREQLLASVWGYEFEGESRTVDIHVQQLRRKMQLQGKLVTIPKLGYRLESRQP